MSTSIRLLSLGLLTLVITAGAAQGAEKKRRPYLRNCTGERVLVCAYNGKDKLGSVAASSKALNKGDRMRINCNGQGKQRCIVKVINASRDGGFGCTKGKQGNFVRMNTSSHIISVLGDGLASFQDAKKDEKCE
jgi:hypothetical protein